MPASVCVWRRQRGRDKAKGMLSIVWWTESRENSFPRTKSDQPTNTWIQRGKRRERKRRRWKEEVREKVVEEEDLNEKSPFACPPLIGSSNGWEQSEIRQMISFSIKHYHRFGENWKDEMTEDPPSNTHSHTAFLFPLIFFYFSCSPAPLLFYVMMPASCLIRP